MDAGQLLSVLDRVKKVIAVDLHLKESDIGESTTFFSLGADSLEAANLLLELEYEFNISLQGLHYKSSVADIVRTIEAQVQAT